MIEAVEESAVDCFTLKPSNPLISCVPMAGHIKTCNKDFIFIEITEREHCNYILNHPDRSFDIFFHVNRVTFQLQHYALDWMAEHQLFNLFVNSPKYDTHGRNLDGSATDDDDYTFRFGILFFFLFQLKFDLIVTIFHHSGTLASKLNAEQKLATINIVQARNQPLPYLLFGPAGLYMYSFGAVVKNSIEFNSF